MASFIAQQIKRTSINRIGIGIFWLVLSVLGAYYLSIYAFAHVEGSNWIGVVVLYLILLFMLLVGVYEMAYGIKCLTNPLKHDAYKVFRQFQGDITIAIEKEYLQAKSYFPKTVITENWLFKKTYSDFVPIYIPDICWLYEKKVTSTMNVLITIGRDYYAVINTIKGQEVEVPLRKSEVPAILNILQSKNREARLGYTEAHKTWWADKLIQLKEKV
jgi:hypothetical protein